MVNKLKNQIIKENGKGVKIERESNKSRTTKQEAPREEKEVEQESKSEPNLEPKPEEPTQTSPKMDPKEESQNLLKELSEDQLIIYGHHQSHKNYQSRRHERFAKSNYQRCQHSIKSEGDDGTTNHGNSEHKSGKSRAKATLCTDGERT